MRILFLNYEYPPLGGGAGNATAWIMREFAKMSDVRVDVVTSSVDNKYHLDTIGENISIHRLPIGKKSDDLNYQSQAELLKYSWKAYWFSRGLITKNHYDLSHSFFSVPCGFLSMLFRYQYKLPYIVSLRGSDVPGYSERFSFVYHFLRPLIVFIWKRAEAVIANSLVLKKLALESNPKQEIGLIYNGVNTERFFPAKKDATDSDSFTILCASRLSKRKGFRYVVEAFSMLLLKYPKIRLVIAGGEGDAEGELKEQVKSLKLEDAVTFTGYVPNEEFSKYYNAADVFVFPSFNEGMSNSMLEAMACGLPIVMTPTGGAEELISEGENGFIVKFADAIDIAEKVERLIVDRELTSAMSRKSAEIARDMSWENVAKQYVEAYGDVISKNGRLK